MPRLPVDGKKVIEYRVTLGTYEREQINRFVDGMQVKNIGTGIGAATDPIEAMLSNTLGTVGGVFLVSWALKRFFNVDVPIPTDLEDISEGWNAIYTTIANISDEARQEIDEYIDSIDLKEKAEILSPFAGLIPGFPLLQFSTRILKAAADFVFTPLNNPRYNYETTDLDPDLTGGEPPTDENPYGLTAAQRECVLGKWNQHLAGIPQYRTKQQISVALVYECGLTSAKGRAVYFALENGEEI